MSCKEINILVFLFFSRFCLGDEFSVFVDGDHVRANNNSLARLRTEIADQEFLRIITNSIGVSVGKVNALKASLIGSEEILELRFKASQLYSGEQAKAIFEKLLLFVQCRREGHSQYYALSLITSRRGQAPADAKGVILQITSFDPKVLAEFLVRGDPGISFPEPNASLAQYYTVVDGDLCWSYLVGENGCGKYRFDSREFNLATREKFKAARRDALLAARAEVSKSTSPQMSFILVYWVYLATILERQHNIHWRNPAELNPSITFD